MNAAKRGWDLTISVGRPETNDVIEISKKMKKGSTLTLSLKQPISDDHVGGGTVSLGSRRTADTFTTEQFNELCDGLSKDINIVFSY